jgi:hypothetical protein
MGIITQDKVVLMIQPDGKPGGAGTGLEPMSIDRHGFTGKTDNTIPGQGQTYGRDAFGRFRIKVSFKETPGGLNVGTIEYEKTAAIDFLEKRAEDESKFGIWEMYAPCSRLDNPFGWLNGGRLDYRSNVFVTSRSDGDAPVREASGVPVVTSIPVSWDANISLLPLAITDLTPGTIATNIEDLNDIAGLVDPNPNNCVAGYQGPDQHFYAVQNAGVGVAAEVYYSLNQGSTWAECSANPFASDEDISQVAVRLITTTFRIIVSRNTADAAAAAEIAYADISFGAEGTTVWSTVDVGVTNDDVILTMEWLFYNGVYAAVGAAASEGEIWRSEDQGESWTELFTGTDAINAFARGYGEDCRDVYAVGASNVILKEVNKSGSFVALVGPSGGGAFSAIVQASDGLLFAGNGQSLYVSNNDALNTGGWTSLKDFGSNHVIEEIFLKKGDSNHIYVVVDDTTPGNGEFWHSNDGGNSWNQLTELPNLGYKAGYESVEDANLYLIVGDLDATPDGVIHKVAPSTSGC